MYLEERKTVLTATKKVVFKQKKPEQTGFMKFLDGETHDASEMI